MEMVEIDTEAGVSVCVCVSFDVCYVCVTVWCLWLQHLDLTHSRLKELPPILGDMKRIQVCVCVCVCVRVRVLCVVCCMCFVCVSLPASIMFNSYV